MKQFMILPLIALQIFAFTTYASDVKLDGIEMTEDQAEYITSLEKSNVPEKEKKDKIEQLKIKIKEINNKWNKYIADYIKDAKIKKRFCISPIGLGSGFSLSGCNEVVSEASIGGKYSGIDVWEVGVGGPILTRNWGSIGISTSRSFTFIQQFNNREDSIFRTPYDPYTKLPFNSEKALELKAGDFVAYSAPLTLSLGKSLSKFLEGAQHINGTAGFSLFVQGEINIHVFRMNDNRVRVRLFQGRSNGKSLNLGVNILGVNGIIAKYFLDLNPIEMYISSSKSDLFTADYIFDLNNELARKQYDQILGQKYRMATFQVNAMNPFADDELYKDKTYGNLEEVDQIAQSELKKPVEQRSIIRVGKGENQTKSSKTGVKVSLKFIKLEASMGLSESQITLFNAMNEKSFYIIKSHSKESNAKFFEFWGQENKNNSGFILETTENFQPKSIVGLEMIRMKQDLNFTPNEMKDLQHNLQKILPNEIYKGIKFPDTSKLLGRIRNAHLEQALFFNAKAFESLPTFERKLIENEIKNILLHWGPLSSIPMQTIGDTDPRIESKKKGDVEIHQGKEPLSYLDAYSYEIAYMAAYISDMFNENQSLNTRVDSYNKLNNYMDLFREIGSALLLRLVPTDKLKDLITYRLLISGRGIDPVKNEFPANADMTQTNLYNAVLSQNAFIQDRSYNLRNFLNEKGEPMTSVEVIEKTK